MPTFRLPFVFAAACFLHIKMAAQENTLQLNPVTITASLHPIPLSNSGRNVVVITGDQIAKLLVHSFDELLRYLPGIEVQARGPMGAQSDFVLRGGTFQQVLVILDGLRINDPLTGHFNSYLPIAPSEIERIEILKGASSAIYGSEAVGGVIQIISKSFAKKKGTAGKTAAAQIVGGAYGLLIATAGGFWQNDATGISAGLQTNNADGQPQRGINGFFHLHTFSVSASQYLNQNWQVALRTAYDDRHFAAQNFYTSFASDTAEETVQTFWNQLQLAYRKKQDAFITEIGYKAAEDNYLFNTASAANDNKSRLFQVLSYYTHSFNEKTIVTGGAQFQNRIIRSNDRGNHSIKQSAAFLLLDQTIGSSFHLNPALRLDWNEQSGSELVPQINVSYAIHSVQLRASTGKTIREADFTERFNNYNKTRVTSGSIGNPDLVPERSFSYEGGADWLVKNYFKIAATYFQRRQKNLIDYVTTPYADMPRKENLVPTGTYALAKNIASVNTSGFETDLQFQKKWNSNVTLISTLGFVWLHSKSSEPATSFYISSHAKFLTNYSATLSTQRFLLSLNGLYKVREPKVSSPISAEVSKDYYVMNAKAEVYLWKKKLSALAEVDNSLNRTYSDLLGTPMPKRWWMAGVKLNL